MRKPLVFLLAALAVAATTAVSGRAGSRPSPAGGRPAATVSGRTSLRWPKTVGGQAARLLPVRVPAGQVKSVHVFVGGVEVEREPADTIVACAHRGPSFASKAWLLEGRVVWVSIVLETGRCTPGQTVAGTTAQIRAVVTVDRHA